MTESSLTNCLTKSLLRIWAGDSLLKAMFFLIAHGRRVAIFDWPIERTTYENGFGTIWWALASWNTRFRSNPPLFAGLGDKETGSRWRGVWLGIARLEECKICMNWNPVLTGLGRTRQDVISSWIPIMCCGKCTLRGKRSSLAQLMAFEVTAMLQASWGEIWKQRHHWVRSSQAKWVNG